MSTDYDRGFADGRASMAEEVEKARAEEREACAELVEGYNKHKTLPLAAAALVDAVANAIRARGEERT